MSESEKLTVKDCWEEFRNGYKDYYEEKYHTYQSTEEAREQAFYDGFWNALQFFEKSLKKYFHEHSDFEQAMEEWYDLHEQILEKDRDPVRYR